jgi:hypothetical protein
MQNGIGTLKLISRGKNIHLSPQTLHPERVPINPVFFPEFLYHREKQPIYRGQRTMQLRRQS